MTCPIRLIQCWKNFHIRLRLPLTTYQGDNKMNVRIKHKRWKRKINKVRIILVPPAAWSTETPQWKRKKTVSKLFKKRINDYWERKTLRPWWGKLWINESRKRNTESDTRSLNNHGLPGGNQFLNGNAENKSDVHASSMVYTSDFSNRIPKPGRKMFGAFRGHP